MKKLLHKLFNSHKWIKNSKSGFDYSEPRERRGDYLPTSWIEFNCGCGMKKRIYSDEFTHLGTSPPREFYYE